MRAYRDRQQPEIPDQERPCMRRAEEEGKVIMSTGIPYLDEVINVTGGCTPVSEGCENCYAEKWHTRCHKAYQDDAKLPECYSTPFDKIRLFPERLKQFGKWRTPKRIGINFMCDLFHEQVPFSFIDEVIGRTIPDGPEPHTYMILTKRPERMYEYFSEAVRKLQYEGCPASVLLHDHLYLGITAENQKNLSRRGPWLFRIPGARRFLSIEPMLGPVDMSECIHLIDWVICGGESGQNARPCHPDWVRSLRDQCVEAGVPFYFKQIKENGKFVKMPMLDGQVWNQIPEAG